MESIHTTVKAFGKSLRLEIRPYKYDNDRIALIAFADGEQYGVITVNIPEADLADDEIIVKTYSENEHWVPQLVEQLPDVFQDTGKRIQSGHITVQVWRYTPDEDGKQSYIVKDDDGGVHGPFKNREDAEYAADQLHGIVMPI